jgi:hypothetical protein
MPETKSKFLGKILDDKGTGAEESASFTKERQHTAQALVLHVDFRDGLSNEGAGWSHLYRYKWKDHGEHETLRIIFGDMCAMEIVGHNLGILTMEMRQGQLNGVREMLSGETQLAIHAGTDKPVITSVTAYPDFDNLFDAIKVKQIEEDDDKHQHVRRVAGR